MDESQFKKLALWQQRAAQIECSFERHFEALQLFGHDDNFVVWADGSVGITDPTKSKTFGEFQPTNRLGLIDCIYISEQ